MPAEAGTPPFQRAWEGRCLELFLGCLHFKRNACLLFKIERHKVFIVKTNVVPEVTMVIAWRLSLLTFPGAS